MADRYWVNGDEGSSEWSDTSHWSTSSGGPGGASLPTSADDVYFDANSCSADCYIEYSSIVYMKNLTISGITNKVYFYAYASMFIYGNVVLNDNFIFADIYGTMVFDGDETQTLQTNGATVGTGFATYCHTFSLLDDLTTNSVNPFDSESYIFNTNNHNMTMLGDSYINMRGDIINLGSSTITIAASDDVVFTGGYVEFNAGTSKFVFTGDNVTFEGRGYTFYDVEFQGNVTAITGSNTFHDLKFTAGKTNKITAGTTQTVTMMSGAGASGSLITLQSTTNGSAYTIAKLSGTLVVQYYAMRDSTATGGATFNAYNSTNVGGNTGWNFLTESAANALFFGMNF